MKTRRGGVVLALVAGLSASGVAQGALYDRGGGLIYDSVLGVTWLQDVNYAATELSDARRDAIITAVNTASPSWLGGHVLDASDFWKSGNVYPGYMTWRCRWPGPTSWPTAASATGGCRW